MTPNQRDKAVAELKWLWIDYPGACAPPSILEKMIYGLATARITAGASVASFMAAMHADAYDIRVALASIPERQQQILHLALHQSCGPPGRAAERVRSRYYRQGGKRYTPSERLTRADEAITAAILVYAMARGIQ